MSPLDIINEWKKGCSCAGSAFDAMLKQPEGTTKPGECIECTEGALNGIESLCKAMQPQLRTIRLYHWRLVIMYREQGLNETANFHLMAVQALNDFFEAGDTAEQDAQTPPTTNTLYVQRIGRAARLMLENSHYGKP